MKPGLENLKLIYPAIKLIGYNKLSSDIRWIQENEIVDSKNIIEVEIIEIIKLLDFILASFIKRINFNSVIRTIESYKIAIIRAALCKYYRNKLGGGDCEENTCTWKIIRKEAINWFYGIL